MQPRPPEPAAALATASEGSLCASTSIQAVPLVFSFHDLNLLGSAVSSNSQTAVIGTQHTATADQNQAVFAVNSGALVQCKPRKTHEDKGKKHGPYKRARGRGAEAEATDA